MPTQSRSRRDVGLVFACLLATGWACSGPADTQPPTGDVGASEVGTTPLGRARCQAPAGTSGSPRTIEAAVQLMNALPKPTSVACFVESLERPLTAFATNSVFSAQPALSTQSPRVFLQLGLLWISIVIDGDSSSLVEFGYLVPGERMQSIKAELALPLEAPVAASAPYDRVREGEGTICGLCHFGERRVPELTFATVFASEAFRPRADTRVSIEQLQVEAQLCDVGLTPQRCEMLAAVFDGGPVSEASFPDSMVTFF